MFMVGLQKMLSYLHLDLTLDSLHHYNDAKSSIKDSVMLVFLSFSKKKMMCIKMAIAARNWSICRLQYIVIDRIFSMHFFFNQSLFSSYGVHSLVYIFNSCYD